MIFVFLAALLVFAVVLCATSLKNNDVSACLAIKIINEADMMDFHEWMEYHLLLGFGKVYFMDNNSTTSISIIEQLWKYMYDGVLEYNYIPAIVKNDNDHNYHIEIYQMCLKRYRTQHKFMAFIDVDEFIVMPNVYNGSHNATTFLHLLEKYENYGGLVLNWMLFGSTGHTQRPKKGGVLNNYQNCRESFFVKTIVSLKNVNSTHQWSPHTFIYNFGFFGVDTNFTQMLPHPALHPLTAAVAKVKFPQNWIWLTYCPPKHLFKVLFVAHYILKSLDDFNTREMRANSIDYKRPTGFFNKMNLHLGRQCGITKLPNRMV